MPILHIWNGNEWVFENNLLPLGNNRYDVDKHILRSYTGRQVLPSIIKMKIIETGDSITYIDQVKTYAILHPENTLPVIEHVSKQILLIDLNKWNKTILPSYVRDNFGNNITSMLRNENTDYLIMPGTWVLLEFRDIILHNPVLLIKSDFGPPNYNLKYSLIIQVYDKHLKQWRNITVLEPRHLYYIDAISLRNYVRNGYIDHLLIRILSTGAHKIDWVRIVNSNGYRIHGFKLYELEIMKAFKVVEGVQIDALYNLTRDDRSYIVIDANTTLYLEVRTTNTYKFNKHYLKTLFIEVKGYFKPIPLRNFKISRTFRVISHSYVWNLVYLDPLYLPALDDNYVMKLIIKSEGPFKGYIREVFGLIMLLTGDVASQVYYYHYDPETKMIIASAVNSWAHNTYVIGLYGAYPAFEDYERIMIYFSTIYRYFISNSPALREYEFEEMVHHQRMEIKPSTGQLHFRQYASFYTNPDGLRDESSNIIKWRQEMENIATGLAIISFELGTIGCITGYLGAESLGIIFNYASLTTSGTSIILSPLYAIDAGLNYDSEGRTWVWAINYNEDTNFSIMGASFVLDINPSYQLPANITIILGEDYIEQIGCDSISLNDEVTIGVTIER